MILPPVCAEWNTDASLYVAALDKAIKATRAFLRNRDAIESVTGLRNAPGRPYGPER